MERDTVVLRPAAVRLLRVGTVLAVAVAVLALAPVCNWHGPALARTAGVLGLLLFAAGITAYQITSPRPGGPAPAAFGVLLPWAVVAILRWPQPDEGAGGLFMAALLCGAVCLLGARRGTAPAGARDTRGH